MNIDSYRKALSSFIKIDINVVDYCKDFNVLMCLLGNDFIRNLLILSSKGSGSDFSVNKVLLPRYEGIYNKLKKPLLKITKTKVNVNHKFLKMLFEDIGRSEDYYYINYYKRNIERGFRKSSR